MLYDSIHIQNSYQHYADKYGVIVFWQNNHLIPELRAMDAFYLETLGM